MRTTLWIVALAVLASMAARAQQTPNLHLAIPPYGSYVDSWNTVLNNNFSLIDSWSANAVTVNNVGLQTMAGSLQNTFTNTTLGYKFQGAAPLNHCLVGNGTYYVDSSSCGSGGSLTLETNGTNNASQSLLNFTNPASFNGLTFAFSNPSGGIETFGVGGTLNNAGLTNSSMTVNGTTCTLGSTCAPGVTTINGVAGAFTFSFSSGAGSCSGTACTFTGSGSGGGSVTNFIASSGSWPTWLVPSVSSSTTTPTLSVSASAIPNAALANATTTLGSTTLTLGSTQTSVTSLTVDGVSPTTMGYVDATSSIQTQLNGKQGTLTLTTSGTSGAATLSGNTLNIPQYSGGGSGTVTSFSAGNLSPLFTTSVATSTTTPALTFTLSNAAQNSVLAGPASGGSGPPSYQTAPTISAANMTNFPTFNQNTTGNAATATALASSPAQCSNGQFATGVTAAGVANCDANLDDGHTTANTLTYGGSGGMAAKSLTLTGSGPSSIQLGAVTYATLAAAFTCNSGNAGRYAEVSDATVNTWGSAVTVGGGSDEVGVHCNGTNWTVYSQ